MTTELDTKREFCDLSGAERVLVYLRDNGPHVASDGLATPAIAEACRLRGTSCGALLAELEQRGAIERDIAGKRTREVKLTPAGRGAAKKIEASYEQLEVAAYPDSVRKPPPMPPESKRTSLEGPSTPAERPRPLEVVPQPAEEREPTPIDDELEAARDVYLALALLSDERRARVLRAVASLLGLDESDA